MSFGELELAAGRDDMARRKSMRYANQALKLAEELKSKAGRAEALLLQARIYSVLPPLLKGAKGDFNGKFLEAIEIFRELKQPFDLARAYYYRAESSALLKRESSSCGRGRGQRAKGKDYLLKAKQIFTKLGAKVWLGKVNALSDETRSG